MHNMEYTGAYREYNDMPNRLGDRTTFARQHEISFHIPAHSAG